MQTPHRREIKSFVKREGRLTHGQANALATMSSEYVINIEPSTPLDFNRLFQNDHPVIVEIGFGMGHSLIAQAKQSPEYNFLGFEVHQPGVGALLLAMKQDNIQNIRISAQDAVASFAAIADASLQGIQIFFPDPWPKKRHHKRRIIQTAFVALLAKKLKVGGYLHCATDWQNYAEHMLAILNACPCLSNISTNQTYVPRPASRAFTKFEQRGLKLGHEIFDIVLHKI